MLQLAPQMPFCEESRLSPTRIAAVLIAVSAIAITAFFASSSHRESDKRLPEPSPPPAASTPAASATPPPKSGEKPVTPAVPASSPQQSYNSASNLATLVKGMQPQIDAGSPEALRLVALANDECFASQTTPNRAQNFREKFAAGLAEPQRSIALRHNDLEEQRCRDLVAEGKLTPTSARESLARAAAAGDLLASTMKLEEQWTEKSEDELKNSLRQIAASRDGEAIGAMATMLGVREDEPQVNGPFAGTHEDYLAWLLVACDLGRDCSENSRVMRQLCFVMGRCPQGNYRDFIRSSLATPSQFDSATVKEKTLLQLISNGRFQEIFP